MKLITLREYSDYTQAHLDRAKLESEGVRVILLDENMSTLYPLGDTNVFGIRLQVLEQDAEHAYQILAVNNPPQLKCPSCQSSDLKIVYKHNHLIRTVMIILYGLFAVAGPPDTGVYKCQQCGEKFN